MGVTTTTQSRRPAGSPAGGQFAPTSRTESDLDLGAGAHPPDGAAGPAGYVLLDAETAAPGSASSVHLLAVVRAGLPDACEGVGPARTRPQVHAQLTRHLVGLRGDELNEHLQWIDGYADRVAEVEAVQPDKVRADSFDAATGAAISLDRVREHYLSDADTLPAWHAELRDYWDGMLHSSVRTAWSHSQMARNRTDTAVAG